MADAREQLGVLLNAIHENNYGKNELVLDKENLRYVVYLRKSSEDSSDKQLKSLGDQFKDIKQNCLDPFKIKNFEVIKEEKSAKEPDTRIKFTAMLKDLRSGKYDGLIAWHPDRLARNMREAGEIIDMLDKRAIKDLLFATAYFDNTASGKMLLGMSFVLSKQYSEHLSENVLRGYRRRIEEGKYLGKLVHGYRIMDEGILEPDDENFLIMQQAFQKRLKGESLVEIAKWLNNQPYSQSYGREQTRSQSVFNDKKLSSIFRDTIYVGFLQYGQAKPIDMTSVYDFTPMITIEEFNKLNKLDNLESIHLKGNVVSRNIQADILRNEVKCGHCDHKMYATTGTGNKGKTTYVYFRCDYPDCSYKINNPNNPKHRKHQLRAKVVVHYALDALANTKFDLSKAYKKYVDDAKKAVEDERFDLISQERRARVNLNTARQELERAKNTVSDPSKEDVAQYYKDDIKRLVKKDIPLYETRINDIKARKNTLNESIISEEKFLELMNNVVSYISKLTDLRQIDEILRMFFSNFTIIDKSVSVYEYAEPWNDLINVAWLCV